MFRIAGALRPRRKQVQDFSALGSSAGRGGGHGGTVSSRILELEDWRIGLALLTAKSAGWDKTDAPAIADPAGNVLVLAGTVDNAEDLWKDLVGGSSRLPDGSRPPDAEILLAALRTWGPSVIERLLGQWAFAWCDRENMRVVLARDHLGSRPLFVRTRSDEVTFASDITAVVKLSGTRFDIHAPSVSAFLNQSLLSTDDASLLSGIRMLPAGTFLEIDLNRDALQPEPTTYWSVPVSSESVRSMSPDAVAQRLRDLFFEAVGRAMPTTGSVGIPLSGGVDSSAVAAVALRHRPEAPLHLITAGSDDASDESGFAARVAADLGQPIERIDLASVPKRALTLLEAVTSENEAPLGNFSIVAYHLLLEAVSRRGAKVVLSGQGADEILCGYRKYLGFYVRELVRDGDALRALSTIARFARNRSVVTQFSLAEGRRYLPAALLPRREELRGSAIAGFGALDIGLPREMTVQQRQRLDIVAFSAPQLLHYEYRIASSWGVSVRHPFLDHRLVELLVPLATDLKLRDGWTKWVFRHAMRDDVPERALWRRDKRSFVNPGGEWLKRDLRGDVLQLFEEDALIFSYGLVDRAALMKTYEAFTRQPAGRGPVWFKDIFNPLALELWLRDFQPYLSGNLSAE